MVWAEGKLKDAAHYYEIAIALAPQETRLYYDLGCLEHQQGKFTEACHYYNQVIALDPDHASAYSNLGSALTQIGDLELGLKHLQTAIALCPNHPRYHNNLGQGLMRLEKVTEAISAYQKAIALQPDYSLAHYNLGKAWQSKGVHQQAVSCFEQGIQLQSDQPRIYGEWGTSLMALGEVQKALQCWQKVIASYPQQLQAYQQWVRRRFHPPQDEWEKSKSTCGQFLQALQNSQFQEAQTFLGQIYFHLGNACLEYGIPRQAEAYYRKALQLDPFESELQVQLGDSLVQQGKSESAIAADQVALSLDPQNLHACFQLGKLWEEKKQWQGAIACYRQILEQPNPRNLLAVSSKGVPPPQKSYSTARSWFVERNQLDNYHEIKEEKPNKRNTDTKVTCGGLNCTFCLPRIRNWFQPIQLENNIYHCAFTQVLPVSSPPLFVAKIPQGRAWAIPQKNNWLICTALGIITPDNSLLQDLSRDYPGQLPTCLGNPFPHQIFQQDTLPPLQEVAGQVAVLAGLSGNIYFHWLVDILPRIALLRQVGVDLKTLDGIWMNQVTQPFQQETLEILDIPLKTIISSDHFPHIQAHQLIVPSFVGHFGWLHSWGLAFLRKTFLPRLRQSHRFYPKRIYISRENARHRRILNEPDVINYLSTRGFVTVTLETLSFSEQLNWFAAANTIIAPHGSGLTNLVFCQPQTTVIELFSPNYILHYFWVIAQQLKLKHYFVIGETIACGRIRELMYQNSLAEDIWVNLNTLKKALDYAKID
ncbi:Tetratricopeptide TPR_1 repeat-containing protein [Halothece sp. PCC 7418]|uniref:tetratricopeptide repeat protein n=1 Tax=Halothece sp. (strain PCC 7418) TaxID=65093 RepID=UPI0002A0625F|nr:tetratricopeptide repeat protein [Halothece sp. PCC 7418]AFZ43431.1 Tetratricopeptide TPR_1 repeat-containing protein [Halothece sp. PCC 7418]